MRIDVEPADTAAAGQAAGELARILRQATSRLEAVGPRSSVAAALAAWATTWTTLRSAVLSLATAADELAATSQAAATRYRETESGLMAPDGH